MKVATSGGKGKKTTLANSPQQMSLDRLSPKKGYIEGNVVWCMFLINTCKNMLTEKEFYNMCRDILRNKDVSG